MTTTASHVADADPLSSRIVGGTTVLSDDDWYIPNPVPGQNKKSSTIRWGKIELSDGKAMTESHWRPLLRQFQCLVDTMLNEPCEAKPYAPGGLGVLAAGIASVARWMSIMGYTTFAELDSQASWNYVEYYTGIVAASSKNRKGRDEKLTFSTLTNRLKIFYYIYRQRSALRRHGVEVVNEPPFDGRSVNDVVKNDFDKRHPEKLLPIPDDIAVPALNTAFRLLGAPAEDVEVLVGLCSPAYEDTEAQASTDRRVRYEKVADVIGSYQFRVIEGEQTPWHGLLEPYTRTLLDGRDAFVENIQIVRRLVLAIQQAAILTIQGCVGFRGNEMCAFEVDPGPSEFPSCLIRRRSPDKLVELFYASTVEHKVSKKKLEWLIGARPVGSTFVPPPVRAFQVLHRLFDPWRRFAGSRKLLVTFSSAKGLPRSPKGIGAMTVQQLTIAQKEFVREWVDLSQATEESRALFSTRSGLRGQQWRTTFAIFLVRIDGRFLGLISQHFKNLSIALTSQAYVGNDIEYLSSIDDVRTTETARFFLEVVSGQRRIAGNVAKLVERHKKELKERLGKTIEDAKQFVLSNDLRIFNLAHGKCFMSLQPQASRCHKLGGTSHWSARAPNPSYSGPSVCIGCELYGADASHLPYWKDRASDLGKSLASEHRDDEMDDLRAVRARLSQAEAYIRVLSRREAKPTQDSKDG